MYILKLKLICASDSNYKSPLMSDVPLETPPPQQCQWVNRPTENAKQQRTLSLSDAYEAKGLGAAGQIKRHSQALDDDNPNCFE